MVPAISRLGEPSLQVRCAAGRDRPVGRRGVDLSDAACWMSVGSGSQPMKSNNAFQDWAQPIGGPHIDLMVRECRDPDRSSSQGGPEPRVSRHGGNVGYCACIMIVSHTV